MLKRSLSLLIFLASLYTMVGFSTFYALKSTGFAVLGSEKLGTDTTATARLDLKTACPYDIAVDEKLIQCALKVLELSNLTIPWPPNYSNGFMEGVTGTGVGGNETYVLVTSDKADLVKIQKALKENFPNKQFQIKYTGYPDTASLDVTTEGGGGGHPLPYPECKLGGSPYPSCRESGSVECTCDGSYFPAPCSNKTPVYEGQASFFTTPSQSAQFGGGTHGLSIEYLDNIQAKSSTGKKSINFARQGTAGLPNTNYGGITTAHTGIAEGDNIKARIPTPGQGSQGQCSVIGVVEYVDGGHDVAFWRATSETYVFDSRFGSFEDPKMWAGVTLYGSRTGNTYGAVEYTLVCPFGYPDCGFFSSTNPACDGDSGGTVVSNGVLGFFEIHYYGVGHNNDGTPCTYIKPQTTNANINYIRSLPTTPKFELKHSGSSCSSHQDCPNFAGYCCNGKCQAPVTPHVCPNGSLSDPCNGYCHCTSQADCGYVTFCCPSTGYCGGDAPCPCQSDDDCADGSCCEDGECQYIPLTFC